MPGDFPAQVELALDRLRSALEGVGLGYEHVVRLGTFIVDHDAARLEPSAQPCTPGSATACPPRP